MTLRNDRDVTGLPPGKDSQRTGLHCVLTGSRVSPHPLSLSSLVLRELAGYPQGKDYIERSHSGSIY